MRCASTSLRPVRIITAACLLVGAIGACSGSSERAIAVDTTENGVVVSHLDGAAWADSSGWSVELIRTIRPAPDSPGELVQPTGVVVDSRGWLYVLDNQPAGIKVFDPTGSYQATIGREGSGPGEFQGFGALDIARDTLLVHDILGSRIVAFTRDGAHVATWTTGFLRPASGPADNSGHIASFHRIADSAGGGVRLVAVRQRIGGAVVDTVAIPEAAESRIWRAGTAAWSVPFQAGASAYFTPSGTLAWGFHHERVLHLGIPGEDTVRTIQGPGEGIHIPVTREAADSAVAEVVRLSPQLAQVAKVEDIPPTRPMWSDLAVDRAGRIWVLVTRLEEPGAAWEVFGSDGQLLARLPRFVASSGRTFWGRDQVVGIVEEEGGIGIAIWGVHSSR